MYEQKMMFCYNQRLTLAITNIVLNKKFLYIQ